MAATRENVLAAISEFVQNNKRRAPAAAIMEAVDDTLPNVQAIIKTLATEGAITSSRGRNGGALPDGVTLEKKAKAPAKAAKSKVEATPASEAAESQPSEDTLDQFAALMAKLDAESVVEAVEEAAAF